jgi:AcrR family transcriptional regulator
MVGPLGADSRPGSPAGTRDRQAYFLAAYQLLAERGWDGVTIAALCARLNVTKGSFYHHFADMPSFITAFFGGRWRQPLSDASVRFAGESNPFRRWEMMAAETAEAMTVADAALRAWAHANPALGQAWDATWQVTTPLLRQTYAELVNDAELAELLERLSMYMFFGSCLRLDCTPQRYMQLTGEFTRRCLGAEVDVTTVDGRARLRFTSEQLALPDRSALPPQVSNLAWTEDTTTTTSRRPPKGRIRGREVYFSAARELLAEGGAHALTVDALCRRLEVTKGSFHWHFDGMPQFVESLAAHWELHHDKQLDALRDRPDPRDRLREVHQRLLSRPDPTEAALRIWAHTEPTISQAQRRIDTTRCEFLTVALAEALNDPAADLLAEMLLGLAIGLHGTYPGVSPELATNVVMEWIRRFLGVEADIRVTDGHPIITFAD